ncbi:MAG: glycoside hydrolase family 127 protein [Lachnospiraceae bacterium]|nr:glycoside hydrolase family 127 protein [Lachnospiraceae bacterium]MBR4058402.1 glycoside hydrolase family 127 protein [Lachnospiraceae bacterium]
MGNSYKFNGIIDQSVNFIEEVQLLREELWHRFVNQFKEEDADYEGGWRGEYWGKMMRGACLVYEYSQNPKLYQVLTDTIKDLLTAEDELGRISSYAVNHEFEAWDMWGRKYVLLGMQYYLEICKDEELAQKVVESMCRQVDYIMSKIGLPKDGKLLITRATRHWRGLNSSSILEPVVKLYKLTKEQKYLDFATYIVNCGGTDVVNIFELAYEDKFYPYQYPVTKAYEMTSCFEGLLEYYYVTGDEKYKTSIVNFANKVLESDFTIIGCAGCSHELFDHSTVRQANTTNGGIQQETCVTVTLMKFFYRLALLTGESKYVDAFEISLFNAYLGAINTESVINTGSMLDLSGEYTVPPDWKAEALTFDSYSPLTADVRGKGIGGLKVMSDMHYYGCCVCIGPAGLGLAAKLAVSTDEKEVALNLFIDGEMNIATPSGNPLVLRISTDYPVSGRVKVELVLGRAEEFNLKIRIPAWSKCTGLTVNGELMEVNRGYVSLYREWANDDRIELLLDMRTEAIRPIPYGTQILMNHVVWGANIVIPTYDEEDPMAKKHIALRRGPIVLAQENRLGYSVDEPVDILVREDGYVDVTFPEKPIAPYENIIELEVPLKDGGKMHVTDYASAGKLYSEESKMAVWMLTR